MRPQQVSKTWTTRQATLLVTIALSLFPTAPGNAQTCVGDCNGSGLVTVSELVTGVAILLERKGIGECPSFDVSGDGRVAINELVAAVNALLNDCAPADRVERALEALARGHLHDANAGFAAAVAANAEDARANVFHALTRIPLRFLDDARLKSLIDRAQLAIDGSSADVCNLSISVPEDLPDTAPRTGEIIDTLREVLLPEINGALTELRRFPAGMSVRFTLHHLPSCIDISDVVDLDEIELDHADVLALMTGLESLAGIIELLSGYHFDASIQAAVEGTPRELLDDEPTLLTLRSSARLEAAREAFDRALLAAVMAVDAMRAETDDQSDDVFVILPEDAEGADKVRLILTRLREALTGQAVLPIDVITGEVFLAGTGFPQERVNLSPLFSGQLQSLRHLLPPFTPEGLFDPSRFPDPTFAGMAADLTQTKIDNFFSEAEYFR